MKILQVSSSFKPAWETGGVNRVCYDQSRYLIKQGHKVTVFTTDRGKERVDVPTKNGPIIVDGITTYYFSNLSNFLSMKFKIITPLFAPFIIRGIIKDFDVIHLHEHRNLLAFVCAFYAKKNNIPYIVQPHGSLPLNNGSKKFFDLIYGKKMLVNSNCILALTESEKQKCIEYGLKEENISILPNGIDFSIYQNNCNRLDNSIRKKFGINSNKKIILYIGRLNRIKGIDLLLQSFAQISLEFEDIILMIVGPDDGFLTDIQKMIHELGITKDVIITGALYDDEKVNAYYESYLYVLPSRYETFPITILEANACGIPVIVTDRCDIASVIDGNTGIVIKFSQEDLNNALRKLLLDKNFYQKMKNNARSFVVSNYALEPTIEKLISLYQMVIKKPIAK